MTSDWQTYVALAVVVVTVVLLARSALKKRQSPGCGSDCGCPSTEFKAKLKR